MSEKILYFTAIKFVKILYCTQAQTELFLFEEGGQKKDFAHPTISRE